MGAEFDWLVPADHPTFAGHFPGRPIVPGVLLLDYAIGLAERHFGLATSGLQVTSAKFFKPVLPCECLVFTLTHRLSGAMEFIVRRGGDDVATGNIKTIVP